MYRNIINQLRVWKNKEHRKPLVLAGARQVGKTFILTEFGKQEFDFLIQHDCDIVPIEAKAEENLRSKSLSTFVKEHTKLHGIRFSMSDYREQSWMTNVPLYAASIYF